MAPPTMIPRDKEDGGKPFQLRFEPFKNPGLHGPPNISQKGESFCLHRDGVVVVKLLSGFCPTWTLYLEMEITQYLDLHDQSCEFVTATIVPGQCKDELVLSQKLGTSVQGLGRVDRQPSSIILPGHEGSGISRVAETNLIRLRLDRLQSVSLCFSIILTLRLVPLRTLNPSSMSLDQSFGQLISVFKRSDSGEMFNFFSPSPAASCFRGCFLASQYCAETIRL